MVTHCRLHSLLQSRSFELVSNFSTAIWLTFVYQRLLCSQALCFSTLVKKNSQRSKLEASGGGGQGDPNEVLGLRPILSRFYPHVQTSNKEECEHSTHQCHHELKTTWPLQNGCILGWSEGEFWSIVDGLYNFLLGIRNLDVSRTSSLFIGLIFLPRRIRINYSNFK